MFHPSSQRRKQLSTMCDSSDVHVSQINTVKNQPNKTKQKMLPCSLRSTPRARTRRLPSGCKWWRCSTGSCTPANAHTREKLFTTCGPDQHAGVHPSAGSTQIKTFRSRGVHFLSGGSFLRDFSATFKIRAAEVRLLRFTCSEFGNGLLRGEKYKSGSVGKKKKNQKDAETLGKTQPSILEPDLIRQRRDAAQFFFRTGTWVG